MVTQANECAHERTIKRAYGNTVGYTDGRAESRAHRSTLASANRDSN